MTEKHSFGGAWTLIKLKVLEDYLHFFTQALKNQKFKLIYIDAFAGSGQCTVSTGGGEETTIGSALRAIKTNPKFDKLIFIEKDSNRFSALKNIRSAYPEREICLFEGDTNSILPEIIDRHDWAKWRGVLFLDPYGMEAHWKILEAIRRTKSLDLWYFFPLSGLYRQATLDMADMDDSKSDAITKMFGTDEWKKEIYDESPQVEMFGVASSIKRNTGVIGLANYTKKHLETIFPKVSSPLILPHQGPPRYSLYFAASNPNPLAYGLAMKAANYILRAAATG